MRLCENDLNFRFNKPSFAQHWIHTHTHTIVPQWLDNINFENFMHLLNGSCHAWKIEPSFYSSTSWTLWRLNTHLHTHHCLSVLSYYCGYHKLVLFPLLLWHPHSTFIRWFYCRISCCSSTMFINFCVMMMRRVELSWVKNEMRYELHCHLNRQNLFMLRFV